MKSSTKIADSLNGAQLVSGLKWLDVMSPDEKWDLNPAQKLKLLGDISEVQYRTFTAYEPTCSLNELACSVLKRIVLLRNIDINLNALVGSENSCICFKHKNSNQVFNGKSIKSYLLTSKSLESFYVVERYLENAMY
jgi:hypothetical protein